MAGEQVRPDMLEAIAYNLGAIADALRDVAGVMRLQYQMERERFEREYPEKREVRDAIVTHRPNEEEKIREAQGATDEDDEEWIGRREKKFDEDHAREAARPQKRGPAPPRRN